MNTHQILMYGLIAVISLSGIYGLCQLNPKTKKYAGIIALVLTSIIILAVKIFSKSQPVPVQPKPEPAPVEPSKPTPKPEPIIPSVVTVTTDYMLSKNFSYGMLISTEHRSFIEKNSEQGKQYIEHMRNLCLNVLEPIILLTGIVPHINSCFRCPELNTAIGGASNSQHMKAEAADTVYAGMSLTEAFNRIAWSSIDYSQIILEFNSWVHVGVIDEILYPGKKGQKFIASSVNGKTVYSIVDKPL